MSGSNSQFVARSARTATATLALAALVACTQPDGTATSDGAFDPYEAQNRKRHELNKSFDKKFLRPAGKGYSSNVPDGIEDSIGRFATNLSLPGAVVNNLLQGNLEGAVVDGYRFVVNTTLGFGGFFDAASEFDIPAATDTDFGETLHVWGAREGAYIELPLLGPSTERDAVGKVVDLFTNPLSYVLPSPEKYWGTAASVTSKVGSRGRYAETIDSVLYDSADSYAQSRLLYLQNRRFELGSSGTGGSEDPYNDPYTDPYLDPYEDPYAQ